MPLTLENGQDFDIPVQAHAKAFECLYMYIPPFKLNRLTISLPKTACVTVSTLLLWLKLLLLHLLIKWPINTFINSKIQFSKAFMLCQSLPRPVTHMHTHKDGQAPVATVVWVGESETKTTRYYNVFHAHENQSGSSHR